MVNTEQGGTKGEQRLTSVGLAPSLRHIWSKANSDTSLTGSSTGHVLRVRPQQLHHEPVVARLLAEPLDLSNVVQRDFVARRETPVDDEVPLAAVRREDGLGRRRLGRERVEASGRQSGGDERAEGQVGEDVREEVV